MKKEKYFIFFVLLFVFQFNLHASALNDKKNSIYQMGLNSACQSQNSIDPSYSAFDKVFETNKDFISGKKYGERLCSKDKEKYTKMYQSFNPTYPKNIQDKSSFFQMGYMSGCSLNNELIDNFPEGAIVLEDEPDYQLGFNLAKKSCH